MTRTANLSAHYNEAKRYDRLSLFLTDEVLSARLFNPPISLYSHRPPMDKGFSYDVEPIKNKKFKTVEEALNFLKGVL